MKILVEDFVLRRALRAMLHLKRGGRVTREVDDAVAELREQIANKAPITAHGRIRLIEGK